MYSSIQKNHYINHSYGNCDFWKLANDGSDVGDNLTVVAELLDFNGTAAMVKTDPLGSDMLNDNNKSEIQRNIM